MYWPIGAPNIYALSKTARSAPEQLHSDDGLNDGSPSVPTTDPLETAKTETLHTNGRDDLENSDPVDANEILDAKISRGGGTFATLTTSSLTVWQTRPTVALASVTRSDQSLKAYGPNVALLLRPDGLIAVIQTRLGYLITYTLLTDPKAQVYETFLAEPGKHSRRPSGEGYKTYHRSHPSTAGTSPGAGQGVKEIRIRFRMVIRIDAGISKALSLDDELVVATRKPSALQCIRWVADNGVSQTSTELVSRMPWIGKKCVVAEIVYDRPMNLAAWITGDGRVFAVQRRAGSNVDPENPKSLFQGFCFRSSNSEETAAVKACINARFSLIAVGCANGDIDIYAVRDYVGNIPLSHRLRQPYANATTGRMTTLTYSPDGHCLFAGYENGWATWSVYGKPGATSFGSDRVHSEINNESWLLGIRNAFWIGGGCELVLLPLSDDRLWTLDIARSAATACLSPANISRALLQTSDSVMIYAGHDVADITSLPSELSLWHTIQIAPAYLANQWPIKFSSVSSDGKYIAVGGRRGLAHYNIGSGRWKSFEDPQIENSFLVRGGMCWYQHVLIAAVDCGSRHQIRLYSRDKTLNATSAQHTEELNAPIVLLTVSGTDSLLAYTSDNTLLHYIIVTTRTSANLIQVGQIAFSGIIRAPSRVRAVSWILPEDQLENGDPSQDVATAAVLFLIDGKLVLLQPSTNEHGELKYDMRVVAQDVEYYTLLRDQPSIVTSLKFDDPDEFSGELSLDGSLGHSLRDSLWYFDGNKFNVWSDVQEVLASAPTDLGRDLPAPVEVRVDFYPLTALIGKGIISGIDAEVTQRRDVQFGIFRHSPRTQLFLPQLMRYHLGEFNSPAALYLASCYQHLPYFPHALEVLLHDVLDAEVDNPPSHPETALLPTVLSFLSSFKTYLDVIVNCTRKTELRSWQTLFTYLPPPLELFEQALAQGNLTTAAGYVLVLHSLEQDDSTFRVSEFARLMSRGAAEQQWELCKELARFLTGIDASGRTLSAVITEAGLHSWFLSRQIDGSLTEPPSGESPSLGQDGDTRLKSASVLKQRTVAHDFVTTNSQDYNLQAKLATEQTPIAAGIDDYFAMV